MAIKNKYSTIIKYKIEMENTEPMHIGSAGGNKEDILIHPVTGNPFIQAASIAGVFRRYFKEIYGENDKNQKSSFVDDLFGVLKHEEKKDKVQQGNGLEDNNSSENGSKIIFTDGIFNKDTIKMELRPRVSIDKATGSCAASIVKGTDRNSGHKFNMEYVGAGAVFTTDIYLYDAARKSDFEKIFAAINNKEIQFGGQKSNGCGFVHIRKVLKKEFNMQKERELWAIEDSLDESKYEVINDVTKIMGNGSINSSLAYEIEVKGKTENMLLVKGIAMAEYDNSNMHSENMKNANEDYIVPGSSFKGTIRNQMEKIVKLLERSGYDTSDIIDDTFGKTGNGEDAGKIGNICFFDTIVGNSYDNAMMALTHRIHIDKFTGGVIHGGLFSEKNIYGDVNFRIHINDRNTPQRTLAVLILALRDLAVGMVSVGSGYNVGKGFINVEKIIIKSTEGNAVIHFEGNGNYIEDENDIIKMSFVSVGKREGKSNV